MPHGDSTSGATGAAQGTRRAVLFGIDAYLYVTRLGGCVNDALSIRDFLIRQGNFDAKNVRMLLAPMAGVPLPGDLGTVDTPTHQNMLAALQKLAAESQAGDEVVIYYAGHGVRLANPQNPREQIGALVPVDAQLSGTNFFITRDMNEFIQKAVGTNATVTVILDSCHSGGATRDLEDELGGAEQSVRELQVSLTPAQWTAFQQEQHLGADDLAGGAADSRDLSGSGWVPSLTQGQNLIVLSGCRDIETSKEYPLDGSAPRHGAMTFFLLDALQSIKPEQVRGLRWEDVYPKVRNGVQAVYSNQMPTLEGRRERPFLGGQWRPYDPGFTVTVDAQGGLSLNGGEIHGLGQGAEVAIYPPGTSNFAQAVQDGKGLGTAVVAKATAVSSQAHLKPGGATSVPNGSRAQLTKPSDKTRPLGVLLTGVPAAAVAGLHMAENAATFLTLNPTAGGPDVEVRPWTGAGNHGWAIVPYSPVQKDPTADDVIAYLPRLDQAGDAQRLGQALGSGLVHWAKYRGVLTRRNDDQTLQGAIKVSVLTGSNFNAMRANPNDPSVAQPLQPNAAGEYPVTDAIQLLLKVQTPASPQRLFVGILLCSNDGNIDLLWPPVGADNVLAPGEEKIVGFNGPNPFGLSIRDDQQTSLYTFKVFASDEQHPIDLASLTLPSTVQDVIDAWFTRGGVKMPTPPADVLWTTLEIPVRVRRA